MIKIVKVEWWKNRGYIVDFMSALAVESVYLLGELWGITGSAQYWQRFLKTPIGCKLEVRRLAVLYEL